MASLFSSYVHLSRLFFVLGRIGSIFLSLTEFRSVIQKFVYGSNPSEVIEDSTTFVAETESLLQLCPSLKETSHEEFKMFHDFTVNCGQPLATVLVSQRQEQEQARGGDFVRVVRVVRLVPLVRHPKSH